MKTLKLGSFKIFCLSLFFCLAFTLPVWASGASLSNVSLTTQDTSAHTMSVRFDLSWDNAWRESDAVITAGTGNHDALWVFMKYSIDNGTTWKHAMLKTAGGTATPAGNGAC